VVNLQECLSSLHPSFDDCPSPCALTADDERPQDLSDFCDRCEVRDQLAFFEQSARRELSRRFRKGECEWSFDQLHDEVLRVMSLARTARRGAYPRGIDVLTARLIDLVRKEGRRPERIRVWELSRKARHDGSY
jgi:hypothetical protein